MAPFASVYPHLGPVVVHHQVKTCRRYVVAPMRFSW
jgi:hypothetical protein